MERARARLDTAAAGSRARSGWRAATSSRRDHERIAPRREAHELLRDHERAHGHTTLGRRQRGAITEVTQPLARLAQVAAAAAVQSSLPDRGHSPGEADRGERECDDEKMLSITNCLLSIYLYPLAFLLLDACGGTLKMARVRRYGRARASMAAIETAYWPARHSLAGRTTSATTGEVAHIPVRGQVRDPVADFDTSGARRFRREDCPPAGGARGADGLSVGRAAKESFRMFAVNDAVVSARARAAHIPASGRTPTS